LESDLLLQVLYLPRKGRLRDMEALGCSPKVLLFSSGDEIAQMP